MTELPDSYDSLFPYQEAREAQIDGMSTIGEAVENNGIVTMEGACGTGKTLTALVPYLYNVRQDGTDYERVMIVTSVKQQMAAFQDEIHRINESLPDGVRPISAITLVGVSDLHPFVERGVIEEGDFDKIDSLREGARKLNNENIHEYTYEDLYQRAVEVGSESEYAYPDKIPSADGIEYDPYYAKYRSEYEADEDEVDDVLPFDLESAGLLTVDKMRTLCSTAGFCPHSLMRIAMEHVDVVVGNYMHVFDPKTVERVSYPVVSDDTLAIFDEAHNLVSRVREFLSDEVPITSIARSIEEIEETALLYKLSMMSDDEVKTVVNAALQGESASRLVGGKQEMVDEVEEVFSNGSSVTRNYEDVKEGRDVAKEVLEEADVELEQLESYMGFLQELVNIIMKQVEDELPLSEDSSIQLRDPEEPSRDKISNWVELNRMEEVMSVAKIIGEVTAIIRDDITDTSKTPQTSSRPVGKLLTDWHKNDNIRYYRAIEFSNRFQSSGYGEKEWQREYKAELTIHNCIPRDEISRILNIFGSSVLMSATLEPLDVYHRTTGIEELEQEGREVYECRYGLAFPSENRITIGVPADKFKYKNRGQAFSKFGPSTDNETREQYRDVLFDVVSKTPGNVLIVMPSYNEAEWIGSLLEQSYLCDSDEVFIDERSSNQQTEELKQEFFEAEDGVLVTGARGTLIEGIDYIGDRLKATVVCGVPLMNTQTDYKKAVRAAYDEVFDDMDGFTLAFTIPAVWKARQAIGRVIRTDGDIGVRTLVDSRYLSGSGWDGVHEFLSPSEQEEMSMIPSEDVDIRLESFWEMHEE